VRQGELFHSVEDEIQKLRESRKSNWINSVVLPVAFQWIEEHKEDVYRNMSPKNTDDIGVVMEAAFKLVQQLLAYKVGQAKSAAYEAAIAAGTWDPSATNPVWTELVKTIRPQTQQAFTEQSNLIRDIPKELSSTGGECSCLELHSRIVSRRL
jgi:hypothetical protein